MVEVSQVETFSPFPIAIFKSANEIGPVTVQPKFAAVKFSVVASVMPAYELPEASSKAVVSMLR